MSEDRTTDETLMVEWNRQTASDRDALDGYEAYFVDTAGTTLSKLENFARHVRRQRLSKFLAHAEIFRRILGVHGSVLDLGVNSGQSLFTWAQLSAIFEPVNYTRMIYGFDSFAGIPEVTEEDKSGTPSPHLRPGGFAYGDVAALERGARLFDGNRTLGHIPKIHLVKGDITQILPEFVANNQHLVISLLHLDMDAFLPTKTALEVALPRMPKGAVIVFDELNQIPYPGETRAVHETVGLHNLRIQRVSWETGLSYAVIE
ncbi:MAG: class I SAM-dependent methyltransferase [Paracoccaceae bacterium]